MLQKRFQQFQRRMARYYINMAEKEKDKLNEEEVRKPLNKLQSVQPIGSNRISISSSSQKPMPNLNSKQPKSINSQFDIFSEETNQAKDLLAENSNWKNLAPEVVSKKEHKGKINLLLINIKFNLLI